jgi:hypothetical protein
MEYNDSDNLEKPSFNEEFENLEETVEEVVPDTDFGEKKANKKSLELRRSIETFLEQKRLHELHDYLWDEDFIDDGNDQPAK